MKKNNVLFIVWGVIVIILIGLLTTMGFMIKNKNEKYENIEKVLKEKVISYTESNDLYPEIEEELKVTSTEMISKGLLKIDDLKVGKDTCYGYVTIKYDKNYTYNSYIKCQNYTTKDYDK